jgi:hypothetical protein
MELIEPTATEESHFHTQHRSSYLTEGRKKKLCRWQGKILRRPLSVCLKTSFESASSE